MNPTEPAPAEPARTAQTLLDAGVTASRNNESDRALSLYAQACAAAPAWAMPWFMSGSENASLGRWDRAEADLARAVLLDRDLHIARYQLGLLQFSSGRPGAALVTWQPLADGPVDPGLADFVRGFAWLAQDSFDEARTCFHAGLGQPGVNPAAAHDVRLVLAGLQSAAPVAGEAQAEESVMATHLLVANYGKFKLH